MRTLYFLLPVFFILACQGSDKTDTKEEPAITSISPDSAQKESDPKELPVKNEGGFSLEDFKDPVRIVSHDVRADDNFNYYDFVEIENLTSKVITSIETTEGICFESGDRSTMDFNNKINKVKIKPKGKVKIKVNLKDSMGCAKIKRVRFSDGGTSDMKYYKMQ